MVLTESDRYLIRALREEKKMSLNQILREFPGRQWKKSTVADFLKRLKATGSIERRPGSGRRRKVNSPDKVTIVQKLICSKDDATGKNLSVRKIALLTGVSRSMVSKIASNDLGMKPVKKKISVQARLKQRALREKRLELCRNLLRRFSNKQSIKNIWFSGEKRFTIEKPDHVRLNVEEEDEECTTSKSLKTKTQSSKLKKSARTVSKEAKNEDEEDSNEENGSECEDDAAQDNLLKTGESSLKEDVLHTQLLTPNSNLGLCSSNMHISNSNGDNNNDVINLISNYVLNPIQYTSNQPANYVSDQNSNYAVVQSNSSYVSSNRNNLGLDSGLGGYGVPNYMSISAATNTYTNLNPSNNSGYVQLPNTNVVEVPNAKTTADEMPNTCGANSVIVSVAVSLAGKSEALFIEGSSSNISSECYRKEVLTRLLPLIKEKTPNFVFIQDRSPAHRSQNTIRYLKENCPDFIKPEEWPAKCPQLNPVDYYVWKKLQSMVYRGNAMKSVSELKERIASSWNEMSQKNVNTSISQWLSKLRAIVNKAKDYNV